MEIYSVVLTGGGLTTGVSWVEARDAVKYPTVHRTAPPQTSIWSKMPVVPRLRKLALKNHSSGFPGGTVVKNLPANAGDTGSRPGPGRSHMLQSN